MGSGFSCRKRPQEQVRNHQQQQQQQEPWQRQQQQQLTGGLTPPPPAKHARLGDGSSGACSGGSGAAAGDAASGKPIRFDSSSASWLWQPCEDPCMKPDDLFGQVYTLGPRLGAGAYSVVHKCHNKRDGREYAVKIVDKNALVPEDRDALDNEILIMNEISHPNIVQLAEVYRESNIYYLVMELARGGELFERIVERTCYTEDCARELLRLLIVTVQYLHRSSIVHRDLKPENLLLVSEGDDCFIKIADFGFAEHISELDCCNAACGTPQYVSPEILQGRHYTATVDIWSIGVIAFVLMGGYPPFYDREKTELFRKIIRGEFEFLSPFWDHISHDAKDFICCMLVVDPERRHNAAQLLEHRWMHETSPEVPRPWELQFRMYRSKRRFRAVVLVVMAANRFRNHRQLMPHRKCDRLHWVKAAAPHSKALPPLPPLPRPHTLDRESQSSAMHRPVRFTSNIQLFSRPTAIPEEPASCAGDCSPGPRSPSSTVGAGHLRLPRSKVTCP